HLHVDAGRQKCRRERVTQIVLPRLGHLRGSGVSAERVAARVPELFEMEPWESEGFGTDRAIVEVARPGHWPSFVWEYHVLELARELSRRDGFVEALFRVAEALKERGVLE